MRLVICRYKMSKVLEATFTPLEKNMSLCRKPNPPSLIRHASSAERNMNKKMASPLRRISDPRFDKLLNTASNLCDNLPSGSRFPKLAFSLKGAKKVNGVVTLNTECERKYRSWSDPTGQYTGDSDGSCHHGEKSRDFDTTRNLLPPLETDANASRDNFEEKSFCDTVSSCPCSSLSRNLICSPVMADEREVCSSKHETVLTWLHSIDRTGGFCK